jgi:hypothetical protein
MTTRTTLMIIPALAALLYAGVAHASDTTCPEGTSAETGAGCPVQQVPQCTGAEHCGKWKACFLGQCTSRHLANGGRDLLISGYVLLGLSLVTAAAAIILIGPTVVLSFILGVPVALAEFCTAMPLIIAGHVYQIRRKRLLKAAGMALHGPHDETAYGTPVLSWSF